MWCNKIYPPFEQLLSRVQAVYVCGSNVRVIRHTRFYPGSRWLTQHLESTHPYSSPRAPPRTRDFLYYKETPLQQAEKPLQIYILERNFPLPPHYKCKLTRLFLQRNSPSPPQSRCTPGVVFELLNFCGSWILGLRSWVFPLPHGAKTTNSPLARLGLGSQNEDHLTSLHLTAKLRKQYLRQIILVYKKGFGLDATRPIVGIYIYMLMIYIFKVYFPKDIEKI